jgi:hypothetical protein
VVCSVVTAHTGVGTGPGNATAPAGSSVNHSPDGDMNVGPAAGVLISS